MAVCLLRRVDLFAPHAAAAVEKNALFQNQYRRYDISEDARLTAQLHALARDDVSGNLAAYDGNAHLDLSLDLRGLPYEERIWRKELAAKFSVKDQRPDETQASFQFTTLVDDRSRVVLIDRAVSSTSPHGI